MKEKATSDYRTISEYRFKRGEITQEQYYSICDFLSSYDNLTKEQADAFIAYTCLLPDKILRCSPDIIINIFITSLCDAVGYKEYNKINVLIDSKYFFPLTKYVLSIRGDKHLSELFAGFFKKSLAGNFKKKALKEFKKLYKPEIKKLKAAGVDFKAFSGLRFSKTYTTPYLKEWESILCELNFLIKKSLGNFAKGDGDLKSPKKIYTKMEKYLSGGNAANTSFSQELLGILYSSGYKEELERYYKNSINVLKERISEIQKYPDEIGIEVWERNAWDDIFLGSEIDTCLSVSRGNFFCMIEYLNDFFTNLLVIKSGDDVLGISYCFLVEDEDGYITFLFDNVETVDECKGTSFFTADIISYFSSMAAYFKRKYFYIGKNYNDIIIYGFKETNVELSKLGLESVKKEFYVDTFCGYGIPEGRVDVVRIEI